MLQQVMQQNPLSRVGKITNPRPVERQDEGLMLTIQLQTDYIAQPRRGWCR